LTTVSAVRKVGDCHCSARWICEQVGRIAPSWCDPEYAEKNAGLCLTEALDGTGCPASMRDDLEVVDVNHALSGKQFYAPRNSPRACYVAFDSAR
jgi:hypothetical protein